MTSNPEHDDSVVHIFSTCFVRKAEEVVRKNCQPGALQRGCSNSTNLEELLRFMSYRFYLEMIGLKRRNLASDGPIS